MSLAYPVYVSLGVVDIDMFYRGVQVRAALGRKKVKDADAHLVSRATPEI